MSVDVTIDGTALPLSPDSIKDLKTDKRLAFELAHGLKPYLEGPLQAAPDNGPTSVNYTSDSASWTPGGSIVKFGLSGGASCSLEIKNSGSLGSYVDGLDAPVIVDVLPATGRSYVKLAMSFNLSASIAATYSGGDYGVYTKLSTSDSYAVTFCKAFAPATKVGDAIRQTFESFILPFRDWTLNDMQDGDYLWYEFDGKVGFAVGAYAGLDLAQYAACGSADLLKVNGSPLANIAVSFKPQVKVAAMDFKVDYISRFEAVLSKLGKDAGKLHLMKSDKKSETLTTTAGLTMSLNGSVTLTQKVTDHLSDLKTSLIQSGGGQDSLGGKAIGAVAGRADDELNKYAAEVTDKLQSWLNKANGIQCNLQVAVDRTQQKLVLASYLFDLEDASFSQGWKFAIDGDLYNALNTSGVTLEPGSGLEQEYRRKTGFRCNFFNIGPLQSWDDFTRKTTMVYAGNNVFHMLADIGRTAATDVVGARHGMDIYFSVQADAKDGKLITLPDISLNIGLNGEGDKKIIDKIERLLLAFDHTDVMTNLARDLDAFKNDSGKKIVQLLVTIPSGAFARIKADAKAGPNDQANWTAFASAADALDAWFLTPDPGLHAQTASFLKQYSEWEVMNTAETGASAPDRNHFGALNTFPAAWADIAPADSMTRARIKYSMLAAQRYMSFCAALQELASVPSTDQVTNSWEGLLKLITEAVKQDVNTDFLRPTALATMRLCRGSSYALTAPTGPAIPVDHFAIAIAL